MSHNPNEDDNETCVPEIITGSRSLSFDESKVDEREADDMIFIGSIEEEKNKLTDPFNVFRRAFNVKQGPGEKKDNTNAGLCFGLGKKQAQKREKRESVSCQICASCRKSGHGLKDCPNDPNARTGVDQFEELQRISLLKTPKQFKKPMVSNKKYKQDKGFNDIINLKATIKEKKNF